MALTRNSAKVLLHMALWGAATAFIRYVAKGNNGIPQALLRAGHAGVPLYFFAKLLMQSNFKIPSPLGKIISRGEV